ncbi:MAG: DUF6776 family protein [Burkholderiaceae bacterium]
MRWKLLLRRRLSISAPRMSVRSHLPWPLRWAVIALTFGFSAALAVWAFDVGTGIAGVDRTSVIENRNLQVQLAQLRDERERAISIANTAESLLTTEKTVQDRLAQQLKVVQAENIALKNDLGFFETLLPIAADGGVTIRGLQAESVAAGEVRYQMVVMQAGKATRDFNGRYTMALGGTLDGKPWVSVPTGDPQRLQLKQFLRVEGTIAHPLSALVKTVSIRVMDAQGAQKATLTVKL